MASVNNSLSFKQKILLIAFGIFLCLFLLEIGLRLAGFILLSIQEYNNRLGLKEKGVYRIMCLGESTTAFQYPRFLNETLNKYNTKIKFEVIDKGVPAINSRGILLRLKKNLDEHNPDMVIVMMGINDFGDLTSLAEYDNAVVRAIKNFRVYKLGRLIWLHAAQKIKEIKNARYVRKVKSEDGARKRYLVGHSYTTSADKGHNNVQRYVRLGESYLRLRQFDKAVILFRKALKINPKDDWVYSRLGLCLRWSNQFEQAEEMYKVALRISPNSWLACIGLGDLYDVQLKNFEESERLFEKALRLNPNSEWVYLGICAHLMRYGNLSQKTEEMIKKAIQLNPKNISAYEMVGMFYLIRSNLPEAEQAVKSALKLDPNNLGLNRKLGQIYFEQRRFRAAADIFERYIQSQPQDAWVYVVLAACYNNLGDDKHAAEYFDKTKRLQLRYFNPLTRYNYQELCREITSRGIKLVCVQYPMRNIKQLKDILDSEKRTIFVDNEGIFKNAVKESSYEEWFNDRFGGDFGHCTEKGNRLLAENVARAILRGYDK